VRFIAFIDKQSNGASPVMADIFADVTVASANVESPLNPNTFPKRFRLLTDKFFPLSIGGATADIPNQVAFSWKKNLNSIVQYSASNVGTIADIQSGALYLICISSQAGAPQPIYNGYSMIRYEDA